MTLFTTAMAEAEDPSIMEIKEGKAYTIKFTNSPSLVYYQADGNDNLYYETSHNSANINNTNYHFVFTNAGTDGTRQLYYISPKKAPDYFAYNKNDENGGGSASSVGLTNDESKKAEKGKWYVFDDGTAQFIVPAWKEDDGTYSRGGCCWNRHSITGNSLGMWGRGTVDPNFAGDNCLAITLVEENNDITTETIIKNIDELTSGKIYTFESKRGWLMAQSGVDFVKSSTKIGANANASTSNTYCQWVLYKNDNGIYLYNIGVGKFISVNINNINNTNSIPLSEIPPTISVVFKNSTKNEYPVIIGINNCAINHNNENNNFPHGTLLWSDGWTNENNYGDDGSCHKAICIGNADNATITTIKNSFNSYYKIATGEGATGTLSRTDNTTSDWNSTFTFGTTETHCARLTFTASANNMAVSNGGIKIEAGADRSSTYTLAVPEPYRIESYSFDVKATTGGNTITADNGTTLTISTSSQTFKVDNINAKSTTFTLAGANSSDNICTNFIVKVYSTIPMGKYYRFKAYNNNNAYMVANGISARMTVNTNPDYAASIFYLNEKNQPVNYKYGVGIADTYNTGDIATTKETLTFTANNNGYILNTNTRTVNGNDNGEYLYHHEVGSAQQANVDRNSDAAGDRTTWIVEEVTSLPVTITAAGYATLYATVDLDVPSDVEAYTVTINEKRATLNKIGSGIIPANTGVVLKGAEGTYSFAVTTTTNTVKNNVLGGTVAATYITDDAYVLAVIDNVVGFYKAAMNQEDGTAWLNNANKAYLPASAVPASANNISFFGFRFGDDEEETTGVEEVEIRNEKEEIFDLAGRRISEITSPGIYIVNGKKVLVK